MFEDSSVAQSVARVRSALMYSLKEKYGNESKEVADTILKIHGLHKDNFDFIKNVEAAISQGIVDTSIDQNSNKKEATVSGLFVEATGPVNKVVGFRYLYRKMKELYGKKEAKRLSGEMYDLSLGLSDSTKIMNVYCWAADASKIVMEGRPFGQVPSAPPNRLSSYFSALNETVHQLSNHLAGAIALGSAFIDAANVLIYKEKTHFSDVKDNPVTRKYIQNCFQNFVHSVNHLSRNSQESPFSNVSIFDRVKLRAILADDNMGWYFPIPDIYAMSKEMWLDYVIDYIIELQKIFMLFFDKGDPLNGGRPFRFPVTTINISKHKEEDGTITILDKDFVESISGSDIYRYNIMVSEGSRVASCCRLLSDNEMLNMGSQMNSFGGSALSLGSHRVVTINFNRIALEATSYEHYKSLLQKRTEDAAKVLAAHKSLILDTEKWGLQPFITNGWIRMDRLFSTFGVLGIYEANKTIASKFGITTDVVEESLVLLNDLVKEYSSKYSIFGNIEQIPGESFAVKLAVADKLLFGEEQVPYELYANQFVPLWEEATVWERMDVDGKLNSLFSGGSICHFNLGEKVTSVQAKKLIEYAATSGCEHFALNSVYSECEEGHNSFGNFDKCPVCNAQIIEKYTRVVGFFTPVSSWNKVRRTFDFPGRHFSHVE